MNCVYLPKLKSVLCALLIGSISFAQNISKEEVKEDLTFLKSKIQEFQPGIDRSAPNFELLAQSIIATSREDSITHLSYLKEVSRLCVAAGEGHYSIGNWDDTIHKGVRNGTYAYFPAKVQVIDHRLFVQEDYSNEQNLEVGSEIIRINGRSTSEILQELYFCIPSDGAIMTNILYQLDYSFPYLFYLFVDQSKFYGVTLKSVEGKEETVSIQALVRKEQSKNLKEYVLPNRPPKVKKNPVYDLHIATDYTTLTLRSFNSKKLKDQKIKPKKFFKSIFDTINSQNVENLVIDVRGNPGGLFLMSRELMPYVLTENPDTPFQRKSISGKGKERKYRFRKKKPEKKAFNGQIYVLIDGGTFSSASTLARYLKEHSNAILIGEETGSRYEAFAAGSKKYIELPNSGIEIGIPRFYNEFGVGEKQQTKDRGVLPDHTIQYSMQHVIYKRDLHLEKVEELIKK